MNMHMFVCVCVCVCDEAAVLYDMSFMRVPSSSHTHASSVCPTCTVALAFGVFQFVGVTYPGTMMLISLFSKAAEAHARLRSQLQSFAMSSDDALGDLRDAEPEEEEQHGEEERSDGEDKEVLTCVGCNIKSNDDCPIAKKLEKKKVRAPLGENLAAWREEEEGVRGVVPHLCEHVPSQIPKKGSAQEDVRRGREQKKVRRAKNKSRIIQMGTSPRA